MTDIDILDKRFHGARTLLDLLFGHASCDFAGSAGDAGNQTVRELFVGVPLVKGLYHDRLFTRVTSCEDNYNFAAFLWKEEKKEVQRVRQPSPRSKDNVKRQRPEIPIGPFRQ
eukprot:CAMPEP_0195271122 /NCGR_PEP_ID=MMETSP0706-20130129/14831_1 /TAXON_ID=33640 /ORGANISM="Asterionellopsis glacialis, Strain CCMP134" /LENGTH=112 /DNA_ID=CAMNT_0040326671 /DNA_START=255 /DNA_END=593 /DNA_ORIENTATION=+